MSIPIKHHYLPEFYLKRWADSQTKKVIRYTRPRDNIMARECFPSEVGFENELYAVASREDKAARQELEIGFFGRVDKNGSDFLDYVDRENAFPRSDPRLVSGWARFMMSLMHRTPVRIAALRASVKEMDAANMKEVAQRYDADRGPADPATLEEWLSLQGDEIVHEGAAVLIRMIIDSRRIGNVFTHMRWMRKTPLRPRFGLLLSDAPLIYGNLSNENAIVALPVSPAELFVGTRNRYWSGGLTEHFVNNAVASKAFSLVVARDRQQTRFIDKRLRSKASADAALDELTSGRVTDASAHLH